MVALIKRREIASRNKELKRIKKVEKDKLGERKLWSRSQELNSSFAKMKEAKKQINNKNKQKGFIVIF